MLDIVDEMCQDEEDARPYDFSEDLIWARFDIKARELALSTAVQVYLAHTATGPKPNDTQRIIFAAKAFYGFLVGEHDTHPNPTEQRQ